MSASPAGLQQIDSTHVLFEGKKLVYFSGCDYFRLSTHPKVRDALERGLAKYGLNVAASRRTTGNHQLYGELEERLAKFFNSEAAVLLSSGYNANLAVAQALAGNYSPVFIDRRAHASLQDAARFFDAPIIRFRPGSVEEVARALRRLGPDARPILLTDGMFSHDGSVAPLKAYLDLLSKRARLLVDDAHAAGVLGDTGRGSPEHEQVSRRRIIQTITLSKAFGVYGGAVLGSRGLCRQIVERSPLYAGNTPLPLPLAYAALTAIGLANSDPRFRARLVQNTNFVKTRLGETGWPVVRNASPIISLEPRTRHEIVVMKRRLLQRGIFPPLVQYPGGPPLGYFRFALSSEHTRGQLENLVEALTSLTPA